MWPGDLEVNNLKHADATADRQLLRMAQQGSETAWETIYDRYLPLVWRYVCWQVGGDRHAAEDLISEVFVAAVDSLKQLDPDGGTLYSWLIGVARNKSAYYRRRMHRRAEHGQFSSDEAVDPSPDGDPARRVEAAERKSRVAWAMADLSDRERLVLEWKYYDELSVREMAYRMGRSQRAVENLLYRARKSFRAVFGKLGIEPPAE